MATQLSFGEIRLVEVARALVQDPKILLLDEPFPGLEDEGVAMLAAAIREMARMKHSVVLVDHNLSIVADVVDRVVLMVRGSVAFEGTAEACFASTIFQEEYVGGGRT
jgi:branched-chain amino acid transport system ATP-binding protein